MVKSGSEPLPAPSAGCAFNIDRIDRQIVPKPGEVKEKRSTPFMGDNLNGQSPQACVVVAPVSVRRRIGVD